jgi:hypothetical protein
MTKVLKNKYYHYPSSAHSSAHGKLNLWHVNKTPKKRVREKSRYYMCNADGNNKKWERERECGPMESSIFNIFVLSTRHDCISESHKQK